MASFQVHRDLNEKENPGGPKLREKSNILGVKQPLAGITSKENNGQAAPRANFDALKGSKYGNLPAPSGKVVLRDLRNVKPLGDEKVGKKPNVVPVVEQFKSFSVYEDNSETQPKLPVKALSSSNAANKENVCASVVDVKFPKSYDNNDEQCATPMSVIDLLSPMSVDRSLVESNPSTSLSTAQLTDDSQMGADDSVVAAAAAAVAAMEKEQLPRNDRQRFFEVVQYQLDILQNFRESEKKHRPKPQYMRRQSDINHSMRTILVDWLVEVSEEYNLDTETLYLSVSYIDRFLSQMSVVRSKLQLVGTAAMYLASKYEEIYPPDVGEFVFITDDTYTKNQVLRMEQIILKILSFDLCTPTAYVFVNTYAVVCDIPDEVKHLTLYLCELSLMEADPYLQYLPSNISAAALALSRLLLKQEIWTPELEEITTYKLADLKELVLQLCKTHKAATEITTQAIREKYNKEKYKKVSKVMGIELTDVAFDELEMAYQAKLLCKQLNPNVNCASKGNLFYKF